MTSKLTLPAYLQSTKAPWASLLVVKAGQRADSLVHAPDGYKLTVIKGAKCRTTAGLLSEFARALDFPDYFGHNWDALEECLADLEWLPAQGYILLITDAAQVLPTDEDEYETLLEVLSDAGEAWGSGQAGTGARRATPFHVLFAVSEREKAKRARWEMSEISAEPAQEPGAPRRTPSKRT